MWNRERNEQAPMVESAFGSLKVALDQLLAEKPAVPARQAGADLLAGAAPLGCLVLVRSRQP